MAQSGVVQEEASAELVDLNDRVFGRNQKGRTMRLMMSSLVVVGTVLCVAWWKLTGKYI